MTRKLSLLLGVGILVSSASLVAHHSVSAEFDTTKVIKFTGKVTGINWGNPHIYTLVEAPDPDSGKTVTFRVEGGPPNSLFRAGWRKDSLKVGETVTVSGNRAKNPASMNVGQATILTAAGKRIYSGNNPDAPTP
jgi:hypothetical protein